MANQFIHPNNIKPDKTTTINGVKVNEYLIKNHNINNLDLPPKRTYALKGVTIHNTSTLGKDDDAKWYVCSTENGNMGGVFVNAYIDHNGAWQELPWDSVNWSCSDGVDYAGGNTATIAVEVIMDGTTGANNIKAMDNAARLVAYILYQNGLSANDLYTHSYWINTKIFGMTGTRDYLNTAKNTRKNCPVYIIPQWVSFKKQVDSYIVKLGGKSVYNTTLVTKPTKVQYIYKSVSQAAIRPEMSKDSVVLDRVIKGDYYPVDTIYDGIWLKHAGQKAYSMLKDGGSLFTKVGEYTTKRTTTTLNVRQSPSLTGHKMTVLQPTTIVYIWGEKPIRADGYDWAKIVIEGKIGYVAAKYLK